MSDILSQSQSNDDVLCSILSCSSVERFMETHPYDTNIRRTLQWSTISHWSTSLTGNQSKELQQEEIWKVEFVWSLPHQFWSMNPNWTDGPYSIPRHHQKELHYPQCSSIASLIIWGPSTHQTSLCLHSSMNWKFWHLQLLQLSILDKFTLYFNL